MNKVLLPTLIKNIIQAFSHRIVSHIDTSVAAWVIVGWEGEMLALVVAQRLILIYLLHIGSPDRQSHGGTLSVGHRVEVDVAVLATYPAARHQ